MLNANTAKTNALFAQWKVATGDVVTELEATINSKTVSLPDFRRVLKHLINKYGSYVDTGSILDVSVRNNFETIRMSFQDMSSIMSYCKGNDSLPTEIIRKQKISNVYYKDYDCNIKVSEELKVNIHEYPHIMNYLKDMEKTFRLKRRFVFTSGDYRYDLSIVKTIMNERNFKNISSKLHAKPDIYEIEMEYIGNVTPDIKTFMDNIKTILIALKQDPQLTTNKEKDTIRLKYIKLLQQTRFLEKRASVSDANLLSYYKKNPRKCIIGPQPQTLEITDVSKLHSDDYCVTPKADGDRCHLYIASGGSAYLINNRFDVMKMNVNYAVENKSEAVYDAEVMNIGSFYTIYVFDCYIYNTKSIINNDLGKRTAHIDNVVKSDGVYNIVEKKHFDIDEESMKRVYSYKTDGYIFTSKRSLDRKDPVYKWKPQEENTIDFQVQVQVVLDEDSNETKKLVHLYVGSTPTSAEEYFTSPSKKYVKMLFRPSITHNEYVTDKILLGMYDKCTNGDAIEDNTVIEMFFDLNKKHWVPYRVREDKTNIAHRTNTITANNFKTALNIWKTIIFPVSVDNIISNNVDDVMREYDALENDTVYYDRRVNRSEFDSSPLSKFHNIYVKGKFTFENFKNMGLTSVFDVACGKGGDLNKWLSNDINTVIGVDYFEDNISNPIDGAYARLMNIKNVDLASLRYVFVPMDSSKPYAEQIDNIKDKYTRTVARCIWGIGEMNEYGKELHTYYNMMNQTKFAVASCQFALHYFFESAKTLDSFCQNVSSVLDVGGYFTGTCFNGEIVKHFISESGNAAGEVYSEVKNGKYMWKITKHYDLKSKTPYGQKIDVYIDSINKQHTEYLVDFRELERVLAKYGLEPIAPKELGYDKHLYNFEEIYNTYSNNTPALTNDHKVFSFLNSWFIFKKIKSVSSSSKNNKK
jgi:SAM-dependent methyltransferase